MTTVRSLRSLESAPGTGTLLVRAALGALPLPLFGRRRPELPDTELVLPSVTVDAGQLAAYARVCGFGVRDELPPTYPHVLAFPLAMRLMADGSFPFPLMGLVHVANRVTQYRPLLLTDRFDLHVHCADLRPHDRGRQFDVVHEAVVAGDTVWREVSTYLRRESSPGSRADGADSRADGAIRADGADSAGADRADGAGRGADGADSADGDGIADRADGASGVNRAAGADGDGGTGEGTAAVAGASARWRVADDIGRRYAAVSGDRNPIHLHAITARALGFPRAIAHGMWTMARGLAAMEGRLPPAYTADVAFKLPVLLPATVAFGTEHADDGWHFWLRDARTGKPHLTGTITHPPTPHRPEA